MASSSAKNQGARQHVYKADEAETCGKRVRSIIQKADQVVSSESAELSDGIDESEAGGRCGFAEHGRGYGPKRWEIGKQEAASQKQGRDA